ncbi:MAG: SBBP repeat-containing protein [Bacteroidia bacterium]|nr:SBBP repeat-containing protein [Bacteroidia bacterium]MDW8302909.1 SBBP repeat-containing protein [Bacteroidia bacterium]
MRVQNSLLMSVMLCLIAVYGQNHHAQNTLSKADRLFFIENKGQWDSDVLYLCRMGGLDAWITKYGVNYTFYKIEYNPNAEFSRSALPKSRSSRNHENEIIIGHRVLFELQNHNPNPTREGKKQQEGYYNYFIGNDPTKHATYVGLYKEAIIKNVYEGIDIRYYFDKNRLRYDFIVHPYADVSQIKFQLRGQDKAYAKDEHQLCFTTRFGEVAFADLRTYQDSRTISSKFVKNGQFWQIELGEYDKSKVVVIDPLIYSTYLGGNNVDRGYDIAVDANGNAYIAGHTNSTSYDTTPGAFQTTNGGSYDAFVTKLNPTGTGLVYSTYIGGSEVEDAFSIAVDGSGSVYITGYTESPNYDVTTGIFQAIYEGKGDAFVTKFNSAGSVIYSTFLGGSEQDEGLGIAVDGNGNAYITGITASTNYDVTSGAFQTTHGGGSSIAFFDAFVTKLNASGSSLVYSTYIGGSNSDQGYGIAVDANGFAYVTGYTQSTNYDVTSGVFQSTNGGGIDVFVTKFNTAGTGLVYSTYIGGSGADWGTSIAVDASGNAYITGHTNSNNYDVTSGAFQTTFGGGARDVFVTKLNNLGTVLIYSTYIGGSDHDEGSDIVVDNGGNAHITGFTFSANYDVSTGSFQTTKEGNKDAFVTKLNASGSGLVYSTYIGGSNDEEGNGIALDGSGNVYVTGWTLSENYDITMTAFQKTKEGLYNAFVTKLDLASTSVEDEIIDRKAAFSLYPNPVQNYLVIENFMNTVQEYELIDISGKALEFYRLSPGKNRIEISLPKGMYFIREQRQGKTEKFVVE